MTVVEVCHLNAAGAALPLPAAQHAMLAHMREESRMGPHWAAAGAAGGLADARRAASRLLGAPRPENTAFGETATRLWASALGAMTLRKGARLLLAQCEWGGNVINAYKRAREVGASVEIIPSDAVGLLDVGALSDMLDERVAAICVPAVSSGLGLIQPVAEIGRLVRPENCLLFVDAAQAAGRQRIAMAEWRADVVVAPARKWLRGPRGQAVMAVSSRALALLGDPPLLDQAGSAWTGPQEWATREDASRFETFEFSVASRLGFGVALAYADAELPTIRERLSSCVGLLRSKLEAVRRITVLERAADEPAFLTFIRAGEKATETVARLRACGVAIATVGPDYARLDLAARGLAEICRVSPHAYTSADEITWFVDALQGRERKPRSALAACID